MKKCFKAMAFSVALLMSAGYADGRVDEGSVGRGRAKKSVKIDKVDKDQDLKAQALYEKSVKMFNQASREMQELATKMANDPEIKKQYPNVAKKAAVIKDWQNPFVCPSVREDQCPAYGSFDKSYFE